MATRLPHGATARTGPLHLNTVAQGARALCLAFALAGGAAWAQPAAHDIPAGALGPALSRFAAAAGVTLSFEPALAQGLQTRGLQGTHGTAEGLAQLLAGSGLEAVAMQGGGYTLRRAAPAAPAARPAPAPAPSAAADYSLREVRVTGRRDGETERTGSYTTEATTVGKTAQALRELPQSVSVLTRQRLEDQNIVDLAGAAAQAVGLTVQEQNFRLPNFYSRGFLIDSIQIDGGAPMFTGHYANVAYDLAVYDRVELLRGVAGLLYGTGNPGGALNLVRKMPTAKPQFSVTASAGRWDNYRTEVDASGPLAFDGKLRGRAVLAYENRQYFVDNRSSEKPLLYGVLEADLGPRATLALGAREQRLHENGTSSWLPRASDGADLRLPRNTGLTTNWSYLDGTSKEVFAKLSWRMADRWTLRVNATQARQQGDLSAAFSFGAVDPRTGLGSTWGGTPQHYENRQNMVDVNLSGAFDLLGRTHELLAGVDMQDITSRWLGSTYATNVVGLPVDIFRIDPSLWAAPTANPWTRDYNPNKQRQYGAYATLRLEVAEGTKVIVGARANRFQYDQQYWNRVNAAGALDPTAPWTLAAATRYTEPTKVTPFAGVVHDLSSQWSAYASYAEVYQPQANLKAGPAPGTGLEPMRGSNTELGLKGELLDGRLNAAFALYRIVQDGRGISDPRYPSETVIYAGSCCYVSSGKVTSQGFDAEVNGQLTPGVQLYAGYTYNSNRNKTTNLPLSTVTPRHAVKLWGTWQLPGAASAWKLGGGTTLQSRQYVAGTAASLNPATGLYNGPSVPFNYSQGGYAVWNAMAEYRFDPRWTLALNVNNVFDKWYYRTVGSSASGNYYGEPRNWMLTLRGRF